MTISRVRIEIDDPKVWPANRTVEIPAGIRATFLCVGRLNYEPIKHMIGIAANVLELILPQTRPMPLARSSVLVAVGGLFEPFNRVQALKFRRMDFLGGMGVAADDQASPGTEQSFLDECNGELRWSGYVHFDERDLSDAISATSKYSAVCIGSEDGRGVEPVEIERFMRGLPLEHIDPVGLRWRAVAYFEQPFFIYQSYGIIDDPEAGVVVFSSAAFSEKLETAFVDLQDSVRRGHE